MAIGIVNMENTAPPDGDFLGGRIKDDTGSNDGTPINVQTNGDIQEFFSKLMTLAGITPNGLPDSEYVGHQLIEALEDFVNLSIVWHYVGDPGEPAFENGWSNGSSLGEPLRFCKDRFGNVIIEGGIAGGSETANIFTLPVGYRPDRRVVPPAAIAGPGVAQLLVAVSGGVQVYNYIASGNNSGVDINAYFKAV